MAFIVHMVLLRGFAYHPFGFLNLEYSNDMRFYHENVPFFNKYNNLAEQAIHPLSTNG